MTLLKEGTTSFPSLYFSSVWKLTETQLNWFKHKIIWFWYLLVCNMFYNQECKLANTTLKKKNLSLFFFYCFPLAYAGFLKSWEAFQCKYHQRWKSEWRRGGWKTNWGPEECQFLINCRAMENSLLPPVGVLPPGSGWVLPLASFLVRSQTVWSERGTVLGNIG